MAKQNDLGKDRVGSLMLHLAIPSVLAQLVNALYNIVDRIYIGRIPGEGAAALTGLGICFPVTMLVSALASLIGVGGGARAAISMGEGNNDKAERILGTCTASLTLIAVVMTVVLELVKRPMLMLFGGSENTISYATSYLSIYLIGTLPILLSLGLNNLISTQGFATVSMRTTLIGAVVNIVLDPIFIFVFGLGVQGAAIATVLAQLASALWVVLFLTGRTTHLRIRRPNLRLDWSLLGPVMAIGISPFVMQATESVLNVAFNSSLQKYGGDTAVGALTISSSVMTIMTCLFLGFAQGAQPILSYNYGAGQSKRVKQAFRLLFTICVSVSVVFCLLVELFPGVFVGLFNDDPSLYQTAVWAIRIYSAGIWMLGVQHSCQQSFVALGQAKISLCMALLRKFVLLIPLIYILPHLFSDPVFAVFLAEPVADICAALTTGTLFFTRLPKILHEREQTLAN
jgi:putative MATE family efflux protein